MSGTLNYLGTIELREYYILSYNILDNGPVDKWQIQVSCLNIIYPLELDKLKVFFR